MATSRNKLGQQMVQNFFSLKPIGDPALRAMPTATGGLGLTTPIDTERELAKQQKREEEYRNYEKIYQEEEAKEMFSQLKSLRVDDPSSSLTPLSQLSAIDESTTIGGLPDINDLQDEESGKVYDQYYPSVNINYDPKLMISKHREKILAKIRSHPVVIVRGSTGCGKTTQVPQYILDEYVERGLHCNIAVTQPRRIAAISVAKRVCQVRNWQLGSIVGYQIALDSVTSPDTRITYMTTGVFLQKLIAAKNMHNYTHVIIDEVHERDQDTDLALLIVKQFQRNNSKATKVILMSATIDTDLFANYFGSCIQNKTLPAVSIDIESKAHEVVEHYITELGTLGPVPEFDRESPCVPPESYDLAYKLIVTLDRLEEQEHYDEEGPFLRGSVLVFLPGYNEIVDFRSRLQKDADTKKWMIMPLHSSITIDEQQNVFKPPRPYQRKIILSTNIAESSITVPDIRYVIDFCLTKILICDKFTNFCSLQVQWASKSNCEQRKGRAGRVAQGKVYRMIPASFYNLYLDLYGMPEIKRCPLELVILRVKSLDGKSPVTLLAQALEPPELDDIRRSIMVLKEVGALALTLNDVYTEFDGDLTYIGKVMSQLPLDVRVTKLILLGFVFDCLEECIIMAASLSVINFFSKPFQEMLKCYKSRLSWASDTFSDVLAYLAAYSVWQKHSQDGFFSRPMGGNRAKFIEEDWAKKSYIQLRRIREVKLLVEDLKRRLLQAGIKTILRQIPNDPLQDVNRVLILKVVICGAFYPNYFVQEEMNEKDIFKQLSNLNPRNTVMVTGLPPKHSVLYESAIVNLFRECSPHIQIHFDDSKAYVQFGKNTGEVGTGVMQEVYIALKMRHQRNALTVPSLSQEEVRQKLQVIEDLKIEQRTKSMGLATSRLNVRLTWMTLPRVRLPALDKIVLRLHVSCVVDCGHFWAQYLDSENVPGLEAFLKEKINMYNGENLKPVKLPVVRGQLVLAPFNEDRDTIKYYRACVESIIEKNNIEVFFLDYGNTAIVQSDKLRDIEGDLGSEILTIPALAVQCMLSELRPAATQATKFGHWNKWAQQWFRNYVYLQDVIAQVYSVVQGVIRLKLVKILESGEEVDINQYLIQVGYAETAKEDCMSLANHELRVECQDMADSDIKKLNVQQQEENVLRLASRNNGLLSNPIFKLRGTGQEIRLRGPSSPLEVSYCGVTKGTRGRRVRIERDSVNSVTLNREPQDPHSCMLVASYVGQDPSDAVMARNTTEMPSIHGLPALMTLLFTHMAEFRTDSQRKKYTGALAGLGFDHNNESIYPDHDIEIVFDTLIDNTDIFDINSVRICMNMILGFSDTESQRGPAIIKDIQTKAREALLKLLSRPRKYQEPVEYRHQFVWNQVPEKYVFPRPFEENSSCNCPHLFRLHQAIELADMNKWIQSELDQLQIRATEPLIPEVNKCPICEVTLYTRIDLRLHLISEEHKRNEQYYLTN